MFRHQKELQFEVKVDRPDPMLARQIQEVLGGQFGEMTVMMQYLFQGFNCRGEEKYKDMLMDIGTEEIGHVEMLCSLISQLLDGASPEDQAEAAKDPATAAIMGGINPQHLLVSGLGGLPTNSNGVPWNGSYIVASGNLLADMRSNLHAESQGRLQVARLYHMTKDEGVRATFRKMLARDRYHQYQWMEAINELEEKMEWLFLHLSLLRLKKNHSQKLMSFGTSQKALNQKRDHGLLEVPQTEAVNMYISKTL